MGFFIRKSKVNLEFFNSRNSANSHCTYKLNDQMFYPPAETGCRQLYALAAKNKLAIFDEYDGENPISTSQFQQLMDFCDDELKHEGNLYRVDFYVE